MVDYKKAAQRLIDLYGGRLGMDKPPPMQVYFDPATPGHGFYAMLFLEKEGRGRNGDQARTFQITGPDWAITAEISGNKFLGSYSEEFMVKRHSDGGDKFLLRFLQD
jgi:hypothetical protein